MQSSSRNSNSENGGAEAVKNSEPTEGKDVVAVDAPKQYRCSICQRKFGSYFALGGHRACHVREERKWRGHSPSWAALWYGKQRPAPYQYVVRQRHDCNWCKKTFSSRYGMAAHSRFCRRKKEYMLSYGNEKPPVINMNFDLNELPPEAFLTDEGILRQIWH